MAQRPGHEGLRVGLTRLITDGLGRELGAITHEKRMPLIGGRADALFGATVFELKSDLRRELGDVEARLTEGAYFTTQRRAIRDALEEAGLMKRLDALVGRIPGL